MARPERGDIWLVRFPFTDLASTKLRPALVVAAHGDDVIVVGLFSRVPPALRNTWLLIAEGEPDFRSSGLKKTSVLKADKIATVHVSVCQRRLGSLTADRLTAVDALLRLALQMK